MATTKDNHQGHQQKDTQEKDHAKDRHAHEARGAHAEHRGGQNGTLKAGQPPPDLKGDFPDSVREGYWIHSPDQKPDHPGQSLVTRSHDVITAWAEKRNCIPATIPGTWHDNHPGVLRFDFPDFGGHERLEHVTWEEWFSAFDGRELAMIYQDTLKNGTMSNFFHMNSPFREQE